MLLTSVVVNTTVDQIDPPVSTTVSLRYAIIAANASTTPTTITFSPTVFATAQTITSNGNVFALSNTAQPTTITGSTAGVTISGNNLVALGFEINSGVTATLNKLTISNFSNDGGNAYTAAGLESSGNLTLMNSTVSGNTLSSTIDGDRFGAGIYTSGTTLLENVTIAGNQVTMNADSTGAGGLMVDGGTTKVVDSTISDNSGELGNGVTGVVAASGTVTISNTVIAGNTVTSIGGGNHDTDVSGSFNSLGFNLIGEDDGSTGFNSNDLKGSLASPLAAGLGALANNGGPNETLLPQTGSRLIDAGSNSEVGTGLTTDQRGFNRIYNGTVDIGAVETQPAPAITVTAPSSQQGDTGKSQSFALGSFSAVNTIAPYTVNVNWGDGTAVTSFTTSSTGSLAAQSHAYAASGSDQVTITVTDAQGTTGSAIFNVTVSSQSLSVTPPAAQTVLVGTSRSFTLGSFSAMNATAPYTVVVNWGDGTTNTTFSTSTVGSLGSQSHTYTAAGSQNVSLTVTDASGSVSGSATFSVDVTTGSTPSSTVLTLPSDNTLAFGTPVTLTATVSPPAATGSVTFFQNGSALGTANVSGGVATLSTSSLAVGSETLTATYNGSATYAVSTSAGLSVTVTPPANTTYLSLDSTAASISTMQAETFTATISPAFAGSTQATGTVTFYVEGNAIGTATVQPGGGATLTTTAPLPAGNDLCYAAYSGDANFSRSVSSNISVGVTTTVTATNLSLSTTAATINQPVLLTASIAPTTLATFPLVGFFAIGTVTFSENGEPIATVAVDANGVASLTTIAPLPVGVDSFAAHYNGDANFTPATSTLQNLSVTPTALVPSVSHAVIPATAVAGATIHGSVIANVVNDFTGVEAGIFSTELIASPTASLGTGDAVVATLRKNAKIKVGKSVNVTVALHSFPATLASGSYHILLQVTDSAGRTEVVDTGSMAQVAAQFIALSASFVSVPANVLKAGALVAITDTGNTNDFSIFTATIGFSTDAAGQNIVATAPVAVHPGKVLVRVNKISKVRVTGWKSLLATLSTGSYFLTVTVADASGRTAFAVSPVPI